MAAPASQELLHQGSDIGRAQKRTFTRWVNYYLRKANLKVDDLFEDLQDGKNLLRLVEVLTGKSLAPEKGTMRVHYVGNLNKALKCLQDDGVKIVNIDAEDLADGKAKLTLGLIWLIILHYQVSFSGKSKGHGQAKEAVLEWCKRCVEGYDNVEVKNFTTSWRDGLAFNAIIHRHRPDLVDFYSLKSEDADENLAQAFRIAESALDVASLLDPEDVNVPSPDEKCILTYVSMLKSSLPSDSLDIAKKPPAGESKTDGGDEKDGDFELPEGSQPPSASWEVVNAETVLQEDIEKYQKSAADFLQWTENTRKRFSQPYDFPRFRVSAIEALVEKYILYLSSDEYLSKEDEEKELRRTYMELNERHGNSNVAIGKVEPDLEALQHAWQEGLLVDQKEYDTALRKHLQDAEAAISHFCKRAGDLEQWAKQEAEWLSTERANLPTESNVLQSKKDRFVAFEDSYKEKKQEKESLEEEYALFMEDGVVDSSTQQAIDSLWEAWSRLDTEHSLYKEALERAMATQSEVEEKQRQVEELLAWTTDTTAGHEMRDFPKDMNKLRKLKSDLVTLNHSEVPKRKEQLVVLQTKLDEIAARGVSDSVTGQSDRDKLAEAWTKMEEQLSGYQAELEKALEAQQKMAGLLAGADDLVAWIKGKRRKFSPRDFSGESKGSVEALRKEYDEQYITTELPIRQRQYDQVCGQLECAETEQQQKLRDELLASWKVLHEEQGAYRKALEDHLGDAGEIEKTFANADSFKRWMLVKRDEFKRRDFPLVVPTLEQLIDEYGQFVQTTLPEKEREKSAIQSRLVSLKTQGGDLGLAKDLDTLWKEMVEEGELYRAQLVSALSSLTGQAEELLRWIKQMTSFFVQFEPPVNADTLQKAVTFWEAYKKELPEKTTAKDEVDSHLSSTGDALKHEQVQSDWNTMKEEAKRFLDRLTATREDAAEEASKQSAEYLKWCRTKRKQFHRREFPSDLRSLQQLRTDFDEVYLKSELPQKEMEKDVLLSTPFMTDDGEQGQKIVSASASLREEQETYRQALMEAIQRFSQPDDIVADHQQLLTWAEERISMFRRRNFAGASADDLQRARYSLSEYEEKDRPSRVAQKNAMMESLTGRPDDDEAERMRTALDSVWKRLETEHGLFVSALRSAEQTASESQPAILQEVDEGSEFDQHTTRNDSVPGTEDQPLLSGGDGKPECDCCCCRCRESCWAGFCTCCPSCHCQCSSCCKPPCCTIL